MDPQSNPVAVQNQLTEEQASENKKEKRHSSRFLVVLLIIFLLFGLGYSVYLVSRQTRVKSRAATTGNVELNNSYLFASPLRAKAGTGEKIRVTVFILDSEGRGVGGKRVTLGINESLAVEPVQPITDDLGRAVFDLSSVSRNLYLIEASVDGAIIPQRVNVTFD